MGFVFVKWSGFCELSEFPVEKAPFLCLHLFVYLERTKIKWFCYFVLVRHMFLSSRTNYEGLGQTDPSGLGSSLGPLRVKS
jgi:hypothetical protein